MKGTPEERFWAKVKKTDTCWVWIGATICNSKQKHHHLHYGQFRKDSGTIIQAHRFSYELHNGKIPDGLVIDHLCRNRLCVKPDHLEVVTNKENILRGEGICAIHAKKTHCKRGHEFTPENTRIRKDGRGCKECDRMWQRAWRRRQGFKERVLTRPARLDKGRLTIDHINPILNGGGNDISNLQTLCRPCNSKKGKKIVH